MRGRQGGFRGRGSWRGGCRNFSNKVEYDDSVVGKSADEVSSEPAGARTEMVTEVVDGSCCTAAVSNLMPSFNYAAENLILIQYVRFLLKECATLNSADKDF